MCGGVGVNSGRGATARSATACERCRVTRESYISKPCEKAYRHICDSVWCRIVTALQGLFLRMDLSSSCSGDQEMIGLAHATLSGGIVSLEGCG